MGLAFMGHVIRDAPKARSGHDIPDAPKARSGTRGPLSAGKFRTPGYMVPGAPLRVGRDDTRFLVRV
jgi:hypothetical protein